jgi:hypothetical protein
MTIKLDDWVEHKKFGIGQVSEIRGDKIDISFLNSGDKTLILSTPLQRATSPTPADSAAIGKRRKLQLRAQAKSKVASA